MQTNYPGVPFRLNGQEYVIPALSLRQFQENYEKLTQSIAIDTSSQESVKAAFEKYVPIIGMALRRNYPEIKDEQLLDLLDLQSFGDALRAVQGASGMKPVTGSGEAAPAAK